MHLRPSYLSAASTLALASLVGSHANAASGGPDAFGYAFVDQADGASYNYIDISATGTVVIPLTDDAIVPIALGAPMNIYGTTHTELSASTNGFLSAAGALFFDLGNACPLPDASAGGFFRIDTLHDDLETTVYYEYLSEADALAAGYPDETAGISVFQWVGSHHAGDAIDTEIVLSHSNGTVLSMVAADAEAGAQSTTGMQNPDGLDGLTYACDTPDSIIPGVTAVLYTPVNTCCSASATDTAGCIDPSCEVSVCLGDSSCCDTSWDASCATAAETICPLLCTGVPPAVTINEIRIDQIGADDDEFFELSGPADVSLGGLTYVVIGDPDGEIEAAIDLATTTIPASGLFVGAEDSFSLGTADATLPLEFENIDTVTHMLVAGFTGAVGQSIDPDLDGVPQDVPWTNVLDTVAVNGPVGSETAYGPPLACTASDTCQEIGAGVDAPYQIFRCDDGLGAWNIGDDDLAVTDTPGGPNPCACGDGVLVLGEECDDGGESAGCDIDCTAPICGDGVTNMAAGEACDDAGVSAMCNADCTLAGCGDGVLNEAAGEECDDGGNRRCATTTALQQCAAT